MENSPKSGNVPGFPKNNHPYVVGMKSISDYLTTVNKAKLKLDKRVCVKP